MVHKFLFKTFSVRFFVGTQRVYLHSRFKLKALCVFVFTHKVPKVKLFWQHRKNLTHQLLLLIYYSLLFSLRWKTRFTAEKINYKFIIIRCFVLEINCLPLSSMPSRCSLPTAMIFGAKFKDKKVLLSSVLLLFLLLFLVIMQSSGAHRRSTARGEFLLIKNYEPQRNCFRLFIRSTNLPSYGHVIQLRKSLSELSH